MKSLKKLNSTCPKQLINFMRNFNQMKFYINKDILILKFNFFKIDEKENNKQLITYIQLKTKKFKRMLVGYFAQKNKCSYLESYRNRKIKNILHITKCPM